MHVKTAQRGILSVRPGLAAILDIARLRTLHKAKFFFSVNRENGNILDREPSF